MMIVFELYYYCLQVIHQLEHLAYPLARIVVQKTENSEHQPLQLTRPLFSVRETRAITLRPHFRGEHGSFAGALERHIAQERQG